MSDEEYETVEEARVRAHVMSNAIVNGDANTVRFLLDSGTDPNIKDRFEETPLTNSSKEGLTEIIKILLEYGADPNIRRDDGMTALDLAKLPNPRARRSTLRRKKEIVRLLEDIDPFDEVSDPDINLMKDEAARHIQTIMRARFEADKRRKLTKRRYGTWASPKTEVEKDRRYMDLIRQFDKEDPIRGYERYSIYPERLLPKKSSKKGGKRDRRKNKSKRERRKNKSKRKIMIEMNKI